MDTITLNQMQEHATTHTPFKNSNNSVFTKDTHDLYVVYSYGEHFPMYVFDKFVRLWFGNSDKYSPTTSRHQTMTRPDSDDINMLNTEELNALVRLGGYREFCADRCVTDMVRYYSEDRRKKVQSELIFTKVGNGANLQQKRR